MPRSIASWMALIAALAVAIAALQGSTEAWAVGILAIEVIGLAAAIAWGIARRSWPVLAFAVVAIVGLVVVEMPAIRGRAAIDALLMRAHDRIAPDREGEVRLPRSSFDESFSKWTEAHPNLWVHAVILDQEEATLQWVEPTSGPYLKIAGRLLALLPGILIAAILAVGNRQRPRRKGGPPMSRLIDFYRGTGQDGSGRLLADVWAFSDYQLEGHHDFIQWLFPMRTVSQFNPSAPTLKDADIAAFLDDPALRDNLRRSFEVFLAFLGFRWDGNRVVPADDFDAKADLWRYPNHNWLRITRVLTSLKMLGLEPESLAFFGALEALRDSGRWAIDDETFGYWESARAG